MLVWWLRANVLVWGASSCFNLPRGIDGAIQVAEEERHTGPDSSAMHHLGRVQPVSAASDGRE